MADYLHQDLTVLNHHRKVISNLPPYNISGGSTDFTEQIKASVAPRLNTPENILKFPCPITTTSTHYSISDCTAAAVAIDDDDDNDDEDDDDDDDDDDT